MSKCHIKEMAKRFLSMSPTDMELVYIMIKNHPYAEQAYQLAKQTIQERKEKEARCTNNRNGER